MLKITRVIKNENDYEGMWRLSQEQTEFLLSYAISLLVAKGLAVVDNAEAPAEEVEEAQDD